MKMGSHSNEGVLYPLQSSRAEISPSNAVLVSDSDDPFLVVVGSYPSAEDAVGIF